LGGVAPDTIVYTPTLEATFAEIALGESATISFDVALDDAIVSDSTISNTASTTWTSLSGTVVEERTGTG
jgi:hypothetical protein